ncbi:MAG: tRNA (guanosine(37)-N1)-methyltransferase TrmD [Candidatus Anammoxibacter sp.]
MLIDILTLFPEMFEKVLNTSILRIAQEKSLVKFNVHNIRDYSKDKHKCVDDKPYGGGPGMVLKPEPVFNAVEAIEKQSTQTDAETTKILLTPQGVKFNQEIAKDIASKKHLIIICGHYEGFDERIRVGLNVYELSIGDYILSGGELPAMVVIDSVVRLVPNVLGSKDSTLIESFENGLLEHPHYTRPREFRNMRVPDTLVSGNHKKIKDWQHDQSVKRTRERRPDLLQSTVND